jgi:hypothetical protein
MILMVAHGVLVGMALIAVFIMFLVLSRTFNSIINLLIKLEYIIQKEYELKMELFEVRRLMQEEAAAAAGARDKTGKDTP